ncbi:hypothetical protein KIN20_017359 [Parelaphostrongylus tenuis]|uniref:Uncharacterized protein n=1 Tax=Parelaphostrongylus tenuis TaxID=148309 RepID=A0AAD5N6A9_PARTN|nr:hypothetical protein KIN20_017359 [Parelaphostrongylus tenuis]
MAGLPTNLIMILLLTIMSTVLRCGVIPAGQDQLNVEVSYIPMNCPLITSPEEEHMPIMDATYCIVVGNTLTESCTMVKDEKKICSMPEHTKATVTAVNGTHLTTSGTL